MRNVLKQVSDIGMYYGDFGGCLIPDAFTVDVFKMADEAKVLLLDEKFIDNFLIATEELDDVKIKKNEINGIESYIIKSQANKYIVSGHLSLAKLRNTKFNRVGCNTGEMAIFVAEAARKLEIKCDITLTKELSQDKILKERLEMLGATYDDTTCSQLYNRPQAYAFQKYLGNRKESTFIPVGTNVGSYPYPQLGGIFAEVWGKKAKEKLGFVPDAVASTMTHGNSAVAIFRGFKENKCRKITIEKPICQEFHGEFCGCAMLMVRTAAGKEHAITICPELADMWRMGEVVRLGAEDYNEIKSEYDLSESTHRGLYLIKKRFPDVKSVLIVEGEDE